VVNFEKREHAFGSEIGPGFSPDMMRHEIGPALAAGPDFAAWAGLKPEFFPALNVDAKASTYL
jgi:hypothetical protein